MDILNYPLIKIGFADQSKIIYAIEFDQMMSFISEINSSLLRQKKINDPTSVQDSHHVSMLLQSNPLPRNLSLKGKNEVANVSKDYYISLVEGFYRHLHDSLEGLSLIHKVISNFTSSLPNPKFHLKLFYLIASQLVKAGSNLKDSRKYCDMRNQRTRILNDILFPQPAKTTSNRPPSEQSPKANVDIEELTTSPDDTVWDQIHIQISNIEHYLKLLNLLLIDDNFKSELSATLFDREESSSKIRALRETIKVLENLNQCRFEIISYQSSLLLRSVYSIVSTQREIRIEDDLNVNKYFWERVINLEMREKNDDEKEELPNELRLSGILDSLNDLFQVDKNIKTANSTSELFLNSALGRVLISRLHGHKDSGVQFHASSLLLKSLRAAQSKSRLTPEQNFYLNYSVVLLRNYKFSISPCPRDQQKLSAEVINYLVIDNPIALNTITRLIPKHTLRRISASLNNKDITKWRAQEWLNTVDLLRKEFEEIDAGNNVPSRSLLGHLTEYLIRFDSEWSSIPKETMQTVFRNVITHQSSHLKDISKVVQIRHNFEEFELDYQKHLGKILVGRYFIDELYDDNDISPSLKVDIQHPEQFYQELKSFYINQKDIKVKSETLKALSLVYSKYQLPKMDLMPYFMNEFSSAEDIIHQYNLLQYFGSLISCKEIYTRYHNLSEFSKCKLK